MTTDRARLKRTMAEEVCHQLAQTGPYQTDSALSQAICAALEKKLTLEELSKLVLMSGGIRVKPMPAPEAGDKVNLEPFVEDRTTKHASLGG